MRRATELMLLVLLCGLGAAQFAAAQSQSQGATITKIANSSTVVLNGYNATGNVHCKVACHRILICIDFSVAASIASS